MDTNLSYLYIPELQDRDKQPKSYKFLVFVNASNNLVAAQWKDSFNLRKKALNFFAGIGIIILLLPVFVLIGVICVPAAVILHFRITKYNKTLVFAIENIDFSKRKDRVELHNKIKEFLLFYEDNKDTMEQSSISSIASMIKNMKKLEQKVRIAAYPEENQEMLSYDELRELWLYTKENGLSFADDHSSSEKIS